MGDGVIVGEFIGFIARNRFVIGVADLGIARPGPGADPLGTAILEAQIIARPAVEYGQLAVTQRIAAGSPLLTKSVSYGLSQS